jgi:trigger factor
VEEAKDELRLQLLDEVVRRNPVPLPTSLIERFIEQIQEETRRRLVLARKMGKGGDKITQQVVREAARAEVVRTLSHDLVLNAIGEKEQVEITDAELEKRLSEMAQRAEKSVPRLKAEIQKEDQNFDKMRGEMRAEKTLDLLLSRAKIKEPSP